MHKLLFAAGLVFSFSISSIANELDNNGQQVIIEKERQAFEEKIPFEFTAENILKIQEENDTLREEQLDYEWMLNPLSLHVSREAWNQILEEERVKHPPKVQESNKQYQKAQVITVDTRDKEACENVRNQFIKIVDRATTDLENLCHQDPSQPFASFIYIKKEYIPPVTFDHLSEREQKLVKQTRNFTALGVGMMGILYALPESVTKWDKDDFSAENIKYFDNVKEGPVWDKDDWAINYIGHPYAGSMYYRVARHAGYGKWESFGYSFMMSTIFWEYGMEAFAEVPSIQDLILTPTLGALLGEAFIYWEGKILENDGKLLGSKTMGSIAMALMDPSAYFLNFANSVFENNFIKSSRFYYYMGIDYGNPHELPDPHYGRPQIGLGLELKF